MIHVTSERLAPIAAIEAPQVVTPTVNRNIIFLKTFGVTIAAASAAIVAGTVALNRMEQNTPAIPQI